MKRVVIIAITGLVGWILLDLYLPQQRNLKEFSPAQVAQLECAMWRSYYERKPLRLFWQSATLFRTQTQAPFWRSFAMAYYAARAAFVFKEGENRSDYNQALPLLEKYYGMIYDLSDTPFEVSIAAQQELEWWIIRRERKVHPPAEWITLQADIAAQIYQQPAPQFEEYARLRTQAMLFRDQQGATISEADWNQVQTMLNAAWKSLKDNL